MATYPGALPSIASAGANLSTNPHSTLHNTVRDEQLAICTELGTDPRGSSATVKARLTAMVNPYSGVLTSYTPTVSQGGAVTVTTNYARYQRTGRWVRGTIKLTVTGSGVGAVNVITVAAPVTAATNSIACGSGYIVDASAAATSKFGLVTLYSSTAFGIMGDSGLHCGLTSSGFAQGLAVNDVIYIEFHFEAAAD